jgi:hypothetical protein
VGGHREAVTARPVEGLRLITVAGLGFTALAWWATAATQSQGSTKVFPYVAAAWFAFYALYVALAQPGHGGA